MTLDQFLFDSCSEVQPLSFYLMDEPVAVKNSMFRNLKVFAMAHTKPYDGSIVESIFGLALITGGGLAEIVVVEYGPFQLVAEADLREGEWTYSSKFYFYPWIQRWLKAHPAILVQAGTLLARQHTSIVLTIRPTNRDDIHAALNGDNGYWSCGSNSNEAIGDLIKTHGKRIGVSVKWNENDPYTQRQIAKRGR